ncbi:MAG: hypothetical protein AAF539_07485 [Planctomycetota bacterium]
MREKIAPWLPAVFCGVIALIVVIANTATRLLGATDRAVDMVFMLNMPMCFFFVGSYLTQLRGETEKLRARLDALDSTQSTS